MRLIVETVLIPQEFNIGKIIIHKHCCNDLSEDVASFEKEFVYWVQKKKEVTIVHGQCE